MADKDKAQEQADRYKAQAEADAATGKYNAKMQADADAAAAKSGAKAPDAAFKTPPPTGPDLPPKLPAEAPVAIAPLVGKMVHYSPGSHETSTSMLSEQPLAAIVTYVHDDRRVNLVVFGKSGEVWAKPGVRLRHGGAAVGPDENRVGFAEWPEEAEGREEEPPPRAWGETDEAYHARVVKWRGERASRIPDGQAKTNVDSGPPRSWGQSPNTGGPLATDFHDPKPPPPPASAQVYPPEHPDEPPKKAKG